MQTHITYVTYGSLPEKYMQVGSKASKDVPPGMELCNYSNNRGKCMSTGSERQKKRVDPVTWINTKTKIVSKVWDSSEEHAKMEWENK